MRAFRVNGLFAMGGAWQPFTKEVAAEDEARAREIILSDLGSRHRVKRKGIRVVKVKELRPDEVTDAVVAFRLRGAA